ncbi:hypothetical protein H6F76_18445 [Leptolyngbya sp. FACHB-321]|uniref:hypothetical protein n=1 Tax=Leptolyngbya sp. FACHB-321 TaxID=2692807 RepID=UPI001684CD53|nr:hypothetical protein [Leptolyngbya sp. FACHB-321]MBD2036989.1 hypothetical protein [Leptolyngbya sp. FACHB-321]
MWQHITALYPLAAPTDFSSVDFSETDLQGAKMGFSEQLMVKLTGAILMDVIMPNGGVHS